MSRTVASLNADRGTYWLSNAIQSHSPLIWRKRNRNLWIFSSWEGMRYADNSKYLFEWVRSNHPEIECYWQTKDEALWSKLLDNGIPAQLIGSAAAEKTQREAGVCICTHGVDDFGFKPSIYGALTVFLGHGPIAKRCWRSQRDVLQISKLRGLLSDSKWKFFNYMKAGAYLACSDFEEKALREALMISRKIPFVRSGLPRNDALIDRYPPSEVFSHTFLSDYPDIVGKRIALYMPTFRKEKDAVVTGALQELANNRRFIDEMDRLDAVLVCKMHYLSDVSRVVESSGLVLARDEDVLDVQRLMANSDFLATDYSSCAIDFALTLRPTCYFYPDGEVQSDETPMLDEFFAASSINRALDLESFISALISDLEGMGLGEKQSEALNLKFNSEVDHLGGFCESTYDGIRLILKGERR